MFGFFKKRQPDPFTSLGLLLSLQVMAHEQKSIREMFGTLMTNTVAAGYVFGFIDAYVQRCGRKEPGFREIYTHIFGTYAANVLLMFSDGWQTTDREFQIGRQSGGEDFVGYALKNVPPMGLNRIMLYANMLRQRVSAGLRVDGRANSRPSRNGRRGGGLGRLTLPAFPPWSPGAAAT
jgi:hypothetical protein